MVGLWINLKDRSFIPRKLIFQELFENLDIPQRKINLFIYFVRESMEVQEKIFCKISTVPEIGSNGPVQNSVLRERFQISLVGINLYFLIRGFMHSFNRRLLNTYYVRLQLRTS